MPLKLVRVPSFHFIKAWSHLVLSSIYFLCSLVHGILTPKIVGGESKTSSTLVRIDLTDNNVSDYVSFIRNQTSVQMVAMRMMTPLMVSFMCLGALIVSVFFVRSGLPPLFNKLSHVDHSLKTLIKPNGKEDYKIAIYAALYFLVSTLIVTLFYLSYAFYVVQSWEIIWNVILTIDNSISFSTEIQFIVLALYLKGRFKLINEHLFEHVDQNVLPSKNNLTVQKIEILHYSNKKLCELMKDLNGIYKLQLLCTAAGCFTKVLFNIYFAMFWQSFNSLKHALQNIEILLWTLYYLMRFLTTTITASLTSKEAMRTRTIVAHINSRHLAKEIQEELNLFSNHISSMEMKFTACGLLTVNSRLITAALATGTTYLVVLVQFKPQI
ncbi:Gustatory receptor 198 [Halyomorpha halys]|nr:Gustatory receptor 198 [Halyomorpha halys]